jgi:tetratricopeptide (TPR) repeat protein
MKSEHRHQLKTNELAEGIANSIQWAKQNYKTIIYVSIVVVLVAGSYFWNKYQKTVVIAEEQQELSNLLAQMPRQKLQILQAKTQGQDYSIMLIQLAENLNNIAQSAKNEQTAAIALIKKADILRAELLYRPGDISKQDLTTQIQRAKESYEQAIEKAVENPSLTASAKFGMGLCDEELGNFQQAKQTYKDIIENIDFQGTVAVHQAIQRLEIMDNFEKNLVFKPAPEPDAVEPINKTIPFEVSDIIPPIP